MGGAGQKEISRAVGERPELRAGPAGHENNLPAHLCFLT